MHDFTPDHRNATCLAFHAGQIIHVLNRDPSGWWDGEVDGRRGWFPSNYVATTAVAASLTEEVFPGTEVSSLSGCLRGQFLRQPLRYSPLTKDRHLQAAGPTLRPQNVPLRVGKDTDNLRASPFYPTWMYIVHQ